MKPGNSEIKMRENKFRVSKKGFTKKVGTDNRKGDK